VWLDPGFWTYYFDSIFAKQIAFFCDSILTRVLPTFDSIAEEADGLANQEFERFGHLPVTDENVDIADFAESAQDIGMEYSDRMTGTRQAVLNIATAGLYHMLEQQLLLFHRRQVLDRSEENEVRLLRLSELTTRLAGGGIYIDKLPSWPKIDELRLVANTVKHGEGKSAARLREIRPGLFVHPSLRADVLTIDKHGETTYVPSGGEDLFVGTTDFQEYKDAALRFWSEFRDLVSEKGTGRPAKRRDNSLS
jgi:hypothetical protein